MTNFEQHKLSKAKSKSHNREQKLPFLPLNLLTKLGPVALVICMRIRYFLRFVPFPKRFLDVGCGRGTASLFLTQLGLSGVAVDFSPEAISEASRRLAPFPSIEVRQADINSIEHRAISTSWSSWRC